MKKFLCFILAVLLISALASCGKKDKSNGDASGDAAGTDEKLHIDSDDSNYDPYAIIDFDAPLKDVGKGDIHIPKLDINLNGANVLSDTVKSDIEKKFSDYDKVTYSYENQYDVVQIIIKAEKDGKTDYLVYYYDALTDVELTYVDMISYCSVMYESIEDALEEKLGKEIDEDFIDYFVYLGDDNYDIYCSDKKTNGEIQIFSCEIEKTEIDMNEIMASVTA